MKIRSVQFKKEYNVNKLNVVAGDMLVNSGEVQITSLNESQVMIIYKGVRYDIEKNDVQISYE